MVNIKEINGEVLRGERALFESSDLSVKNCVFEDGESPLKESRNINIKDSVFKWKYPLWYCKNVSAENCALLETARAGMWYTDGIYFTDTVIEAPKSFRRCKNIGLKKVLFVNAQETLWNCESVKMENVSAKGDYFAMNCVKMNIDKLDLVGNYCFDGARDIEIRDSKLLSKDAFWNSENITVYNSFICGEYLGWNAKNLTLVDCTIESLQGMCYIENLVMKNCRLLNTTLAFEYSTVNADIRGGIDSVKNPLGGKIEADMIGDIIMEENMIDPEKTEIVLRR